LKKGDIVFTRVGSVDLSAWVKPHQDGWMFSSRMLRVRLKEGVDSKFISFFFQQKSFRDFILNISVGATMPSINTGILEGISISYPPLPEQKAIAAVLSSLDDKIDLLHRQNKTLEALAETLFRQWFVEEAEEGWEIVRVGDFVKTNAKNIDKDFAIKKIRYLDTGSLIEGLISEYQTYELSEAPSRARRIVQHNDILISTVRPNQKHYGILKKPEKDIIVSTGFCVITCDKIDPHFIYLLLTTDEMTEFLHAIAEGSTTTYPSLKPSDIEGLEFQLPTRDKLKLFSECTSEAWNKIDSNKSEIRSLEALRDTLLPKLMSGEVRVAL